MSIVLPVYNGAEYVADAMASMLAQTFTDYELIVIDDGSRDNTLKVVERHSDPRIRVFTQPNRGLAATLNRGIALARGRYIARQDQDDMSFPERLAKQVALMDAQRQCALVGTWAEIWQGRFPTSRAHHHPAGNSSLKFEMLLNNPFVHSSVMIRKSALERVGGYSTDPARQPPEDYELWSRIAREFEVANIPENLHRYREVSGSMSRDGATPFLDRLVTISSENLAWACALPPDDAQLVNIAALTHGAFHRLTGEPDFHRMSQIFRYAAERVVAPAERKKYARKAEERVLALKVSIAGRSRRVGRLHRVVGRVARRMVRGLFGGG